jgi:hypothetical protein
LQELSDLAIGQLLEVAPQEDAPLVLVEPAQGQPQALGHFRSGGGLAGRGALAHQGTDEGGRGVHRQRWRLAADGAHVGGEVLPVGGQDPLAGQPVQPQVEGHVLVFQVRRQPPGRLQVRLLLHVGDVHPRRQASVQAQGDAAPHSRPVAGEQLVKGRPLP